MAECKENEEMKTYRCFFELALDIIAGKWKLIILYYIANKDSIRYGELKKSIPDINERMLTRQLRELERDQLIHREVYKQVPPKVEYSLTQIGKSIIPLMDQLENWGVSYNQKVKNVCVQTKTNDRD